MPKLTELDGEFSELTELDGKLSELAEVDAGLSGLTKLDAGIGELINVNAPSLIPIDPNIIPGLYWPSQYNMLKYCVLYWLPNT
jgi:hypothetical protein